MEDQTRGQAVQTEQVEENRRRAMKSNLFDDPQTPNQGYAQNNNQMHQQYQQYQYQVNIPQKNYSTNQPAQPQLIPANLATFPDFQADLSEIPTHFDLGIHPRENKIEPRVQKLNFPAGNQMKQLREDLARDYQQFAERIKHINDSAPITMDTIKFAPLEEPKRTLPPTNDNMQPKVNFAQKDRSQPNLNDEPSMQVSGPSMQISGPSFTTASQFILPDGSNYQDS